MNRFDVRFEEAMIKDPSDAGNFLVYADWLADDGRADEGFVFRWMAKTGRRPFFRDRYEGVDGKDGPKVPGRYSWGWYCPQIIFPKFKPADLRRFMPRPPTSAVLPMSVFLARRVGPAHRYFPSWRAAVGHLGMLLDVVADDLSGRPLTEEMPTGEDDG